MFQTSQDREYFNLCVERAKTIYLDWIEQFLDLIAESEAHFQSVNDIGCNVGQFWKGMKRRNLEIQYSGYDIDETYLKAATELFPEVKSSFRHLDICNGKPEPAELSVVSATLEHLPNVWRGVENILGSTHRTAVIRTFLGSESKQQYYRKKGAECDCLVRQFSFEEMLEAIHNQGFATKVLRDRATDSMPKHIESGIVRTQYVIWAQRKDG